MPRMRYKGTQLSTDTFKTSNLLNIFYHLPNRLSQV